MDLMVLVGILIAYFFGISGIILSSIAPEELKVGKKYFRFFQKLIISLAVFFMCVIIFGNFGVWAYVVGTIIGLLLWKVRFTHQILYFVFPLVIYMFSAGNYVGLYLSLFLLYGLFYSPNIVVQYVKGKDMREISESKVAMTKEMIGKTNLFFISYFIVVILYVVSLF